MPLAAEQFIAGLKNALESKKALHDHPWVKKFERGELTREQVRHWIEQQNYVTGLGINVIMGGLYAKCADLEARQEIVESLIEEETGKISGTAPHPELYIRLGEALGSSRERMLNIKPIPEARALRGWYELMMSPTRSFAEGLAMGVGGESQLPGPAGVFARVLEEKYGLSHEDSAFWWVHDSMDREHGEAAFQVLARVANTDETQKRVQDAVLGYLDLWWLFFDGLERSSGAAARVA